jgi:hypothetical protein
MTDLARVEKLIADYEYDLTSEDAEEFAFETHYQFATHMRQLAPLMVAEIEAWRAKEAARIRYTNAEWDCWKW